MTPKHTKEEKIEGKDCCKKCYSTYTDHTYPAHTVYDACINPVCECHTPPKIEEQSWHKKLFIKLSELSQRYSVWWVDTDNSRWNITNNLDFAEEIENFIRTELLKATQSAREEVLRCLEEKTKDNITLGEDATPYGEYVHYDIIKSIIEETKQ